MRSFLKKGIIVIVVLAIFSIICNAYLNRYISYVLFKNGIYKSNIIFHIDSFSAQHHYLYKKDSELSLISFYKENEQSKKWFIRNHDTINISDYKYPLHTFYSTEKNGQPDGGSIIAGITKTDKNILLETEDNKTIKPTLQVCEDEYTYYLHIFDYTLRNTRNISIINDDE